MTLVVRCPPSFSSERAYVFDVLLRRFLGVDFSLVTHPGPTVELALDGRRLIVPDAFLGNDESAWLTPRSMPVPGVPRFDTRGLLNHPGVPTSVPVLFGSDVLQIAEREIRLGIDVFGSSFFLLSRYEEAVIQERDRHDRFPAEASLAWREGFLDYPLVNVYLEILWACMHRLWPNLERRARKARTLVSCDVDLPLDPALWSWLSGGHKLVRAFLRREPAAAARLIRNVVAVRRHGIAADPYYTFNEYMDWLDEAGLKAAFYFIAGHTGGRIDGRYELDDPMIRGLMSEIHRRGHEIGLHPSYNTYCSATRLRSEFDALRRACAEIGIQQEAWGGRQHFLRWRPSTFRHWQTAGLAYDSTLTFAERPGFRAGVCYEYNAYDLQERAPLTLVVRPLVAMDGSLLSEDYMALPHNAAARLLHELMARCTSFDGDFTLLWHNSMLETPDDRQLFRSLLSRAARQRDGLCAASVSGATDAGGTA